MQKKIFLTVNCLVIALVLLVGGIQAPVAANETQNEKIEAIIKLTDEINYFYLHPNAENFMNSFYTSTSFEALQVAFNQAQEMKITNWETELNETELTELYELLHGAVTSLSPQTIRRGEATAQGQDLNFRALPATETQVFYTLTYGTAFEILEEVQGGAVVGEDNVSSNQWFRVRHHDQIGYVHGRYVRHLPVSQERINYLANIARQELRIRSKIDGWQTTFSLSTQEALQEILNDAQDLKVGNWQFDFSYLELDHLLQSLSYDHLNLVTLFRYELINEIIALKSEIENNIQGSGNARREHHTVNSWEEMEAALTEARVILIEDWQDSLSDEVLTEVRNLLRSGLDNLELIPEPILEDESDSVEVETGSGFNRALLPILGSIGLVGLILIFKVIQLIRYRLFD